MRNLLAAILFACAAWPAQAQLSIEITGAGGQRIAIAVAPLAGEGALLDGANASISAIVRADLERSGLFRGLEVPRLVPQLTEASSVNYAEWRSRLADTLVLGSVAARPDGRFEVRFRLYDVVRQVALGGVAYTLTREQVRATAHRIADYVYEKLTGEKGVFSTRIAYVVKRGERFELQVADADGANEQAMLVSAEPIISPAWSPDGRRLAYVSFQNKKPIVYVQDIEVPKQQIVANFKGSNSAPAWSPDGRRLALVLTRDGNSQIYLINPDGSNLQRLTRSSGIDTEPFFSPDGQWLFFTSDRGGSPQIYRMPAAGGDAQRVTFEGSYNVSPRVSPDGKNLAFIMRDGSRFQAALLDLNTRQVQVLTDSDLDESPSFAPNGRQILLATIIAGRGVLTSVSADGRVKQRLTVSAADVREPAWGPLNK
ncbi:MAG: Tol-Pal system beta propeller repeat protein TolB [Betaproteobacteria bacterium]|nr:Tol-Pal system beta propeller repeat protein TolB [Betaproteobacteria bacterium]